MHLYVITYDRTTVKIGVTVNVGRRLNQLQIGNSRKLQVFAQFPVGNKRQAHRTEAAVHRRLKAYRLEGEWFAVTAADAVAMITAVISGGPPKTVREGPSDADLCIGLTCPYCSHQSRTKLDRKAIWAGKFRCTQCDRSVPGRRLLVRLLNPCRRIA
jgi:predicted GIY-YIG superfamily endonuclease